MKIFLALLGLLLLPFTLTSTSAQTVTPPLPTAALVCAYNSSPPAIATGNFAYVQCDASGHIISSSSFATVPFTATGGNTATSLAKRASMNGVHFDVRSDWNLACDGVTNDTTNFTAMKTAVNALAVPVTLVFPGVCLIDAGNYVFTKNITWEGAVAGAGLKLSTASLSLTQNLLQHNITSGAVTFHHFTLDLNSAGSPTNALAAIYASPGSGVIFDDSSVLNSGIVGAAPAALLSIASYGPAFCEITHSTFTATLVQNTQSRALNIGGLAGNAGSDCLVDHNTVVNNGFAFTCINHLVVDSNNISGWGYGAAVGTNACGTTELPAVISNNILHDSGSAADVTGDKISAIETWQYGVTVSGNKIWNTCGPGISIGGQSLVTSNEISDPGSCLQGNALQSGLLTVDDGTERGSNSVITGNKVYDTTGRTLYGYSDGINITGVALGNNDFNGVYGAYNITGGSYFLSPSRDNRLTNGCMNYDQRNEGASFTTGGATTYSADQWHWQMTANTGFTTINTATATLGNCSKVVNIVVTNTRTSASTDFEILFQNLIFNDVSDLHWNTNTAIPLIYKFCVKNVNLTPPYIGSYYIQSVGAPAQSYVGNYTLTVAGGSSQCFSFRIPAGPIALRNTVGGTTSALTAAINIGSGSARVTSTLNQWIAGSFYGSSTSTPFNGLANGSNIQLSDFALYPAAADNGSVPRTFVEDLPGVLRFYRKSFAFGTAPATNAGTTGQLCTSVGSAVEKPSIPVVFGQPMVISPTITLFNPSAANANLRDQTASADVVAGVGTGATSTNGFLMAASGTVATAGDIVCGHYTAEGGI